MMPTGGYWTDEVISCSPVIFWRELSLAQEQLPI